MRSTVVRRKVQGEYGRVRQTRRKRTSGRGIDAAGAAGPRLEGDVVAKVPRCHTLFLHPTMRRGGLLAGPWRAT